jgi:hypothetical protein
MRELTYAVEGKAANLRTFAIGDVGRGGACRRYHISREISDPDHGDVLAEIQFQDGPIDADGNGVNGIQHEDLLAILIDRLEGMQRGAFACDENGFALRHLCTALELLQQRSRDRIARGVEGTHAV